MYRKLFSKTILSSWKGIKIISFHKTRLRGEIIHLFADSQKEAFLKIGTGYKKQEIMREYKNLCALKGHLPVPQIYDYIDLEKQALIILKKLPGLPFHLMIPSLGRQRSISILKEDSQCVSYSA